MGSPTKENNELADRLAGIPGAVARRDAIAEALDDAFQAGRASPLTPAAAASSLTPWDIYAASVLSGLTAASPEVNDSDDDVKEDADFAAKLADAMLAERVKRYSLPGRGRP